MNKKEYDEKIRAIESESLRKQDMVMKEYALSNAKAKVGDKIETTDRTGVVKRVSWREPCRLYALPEAIYRCFGLNKDGTPSKRNPSIKISDRDIKKINGVNVEPIEGGDV